MATKAATVQDYLAAQPGPVAERLELVRTALHAAVPGAQERITYGIPTLVVDGRKVVHFSGWKHHIAIYPQPQASGADDAAIAAYATGRGTLQFPHAQDLPLALIGRIGELLAAGEATADD